MFVVSSKNKYGPSESELSILKIPILCFFENNRLINIPQTQPIININMYSISYPPSCHIYTHIRITRFIVTCVLKIKKKKESLLRLNLLRDFTFVMFLKIIRLKILHKILRNYAHYHILHTQL